MFSLKDAEMFEGDLPLRYQVYVRQFIAEYRDELYRMWENQEFRKLPFME